MKSDKFECSKKKQVVGTIGGCAYLDPKLCNHFSTCHMRFVLAEREANANNKDIVIH